MSDTVARHATEHSATYELFLQQLTEQEVQLRQVASIGRRLKQAGFPVVKELSEFDFTTAPRLNKKRMLYLAQCRFVDQRSNLVLNGAPARVRRTWRLRCDARRVATSFTHICTLQRFSSRVENLQPVVTSACSTKALQCSGGESTRQDVAPS
jgi:hypothetical protein